MTLQKLSAAIGILALWSLATLAAGAPDISGTWTASFDTQVGKQEYTYTFVAKGAQLTGRAKSANGDTPITEGKIEGNKVSFVENLTYQGMPLRIAYTGTIASADQIDFTRDVGGVATEMLTAKRSK
jgi:hypothetical protein